MESGVVYIAFGDKYVDEVLFSAATLKAVSDLHITLFADRKVTSPNLDSIVLIEPNHKRPKVDCLPQSPYERTLYLDSDTRIERDLTDVFAVLDRFDLAAVHDRARKSSRWATAIPEYDAIPYGFPEYNSGVVLFRKCSRVDSFFKLWQEYFHRYRTATGRDQPSFRIALWQSDLHIHSLPVEYNVRNLQTRKKTVEKAKSPADEGLLKPRILHWHGLNRKTPFSWLSAKYRAIPY